MRPTGFSISTVTVTLLSAAFIIALLGVIPALKILNYN